MESCVEFEVLHTARGVRIGSWRCHSPSSEPIGEEHTKFFEVVIPRSGAFVKHLGRRRIFADPNHVIFFNPGETYRVSHPVSGGDQCTVFLLEDEALWELLAWDGRPIGGRLSLPVCAALIDSLSYSSHRRVLDLLDQGPKPDPLALEEMIIRLLSRLLTRTEATGVERPSRRRAGTSRDRRRAIESVMQLLSARFNQRLTLDDVAAETYYSKYHLARLFRSEVGLPIHRYLTRLRLRAALDRVFDPAIDLSRLALQLGFSSHSHLTSSFRREFGHTPSELRRRASTLDLRQLSKNLKA